MHRRSVVASTLAPMILCLGAAALIYGCGGGGGALGGGLPAGYVAANGMTGGKAFDRFWAPETGWSQADPNLATFNGKADFFRCKQCHGWDLIGSKGAYINRAATATRPHVSGLDLRSIAATKTPQELFDAMKSSAGRRSVTADLSTYDPATNATVGDQMPNYGAFMTDAEIWDVVKFLKAEAIDTRLLYDQAVAGTYPTGTITFSNIGKDGIASLGDTVYTNKCAGCHGANGKLISLGGSSVGKFMRDRPHESQHKVKYGQLGSGMGALVSATEEMKNLYRAITNTVKYPD